MRCLVIQNKEFESLGTLKLFEYDLIEADEGEDIPRLEGYDALIILGGPVSAYDDLAYLREEEKLIKEAIKKDIPTLGICLGSQLIAKACNARVYKGMVKEIGWYRVYLHNTLAETFNINELRVFQWHNDTFELPDGAELLASSPSYPIQAFRIGSAVGVQFHLEVTKDMILEWLDKYREEIDDNIRSSIIKEIDNASVLEQYAHQLWNYTLRRYG